MPGGDIQVMEYDGGATIFLGMPAQRAEDLHLKSRIQIRYRFVRKNEFMTAGDQPGDVNTGQFATGQHVSAAIEQRVQIRLADRICDQTAIVFAQRAETANVR